METFIQEQKGLKQAVRALVEQAIQDKVFPGCATIIFSDVYSENNVSLYLGSKRYENEGDFIQPDTWFDIASLTKGIINILALVLREQGHLNLETPVGEILGLRGKWTEHILIRHLLTFTVDFKIDQHLGKCKGPEEFMSIVQDADLRFPPGEEHKYRDLTSVLLGLYLEKVFGKRLEKLLGETLLAPLGLQDKIVFQPRKQMVSLKSIAPCEEEHTSPDVQLYDTNVGIVHDETARLFLPRNVGCAGLFATAEGLKELFTSVLASFARREGKEKKLFRDPESLKILVTDQLSIEGHAFSMGFDKFYAVSPHYTSCECFNRNAILFTAFTGCSVMLDPISRRTGIIILTNRTYPRRPEDNEAIRIFRKKIANLVLSSYPRCIECNQRT